MAKRLHGRRSDGARRDQYVMWRQVIIAAAISFAVAASVFVYQFTFTGRQGTGGPRPSVQQLLQKRLKRDQLALDRGALTYSRLTRLYTNVPTTFTATVTDLGKHPHGDLTAAELSSALGLVVYPGDVPTGGIVELRISVCADLKCHPLNTSAKQAVAVEGSQRSWSWRLTPRLPGLASIVIVATIYDGETDATLSQEIIPIKIAVVPTHSFEGARSSRQLHEIFGSTLQIAGLVTAVGGALAVIVGAIASIVRWRRRSKTKKAQRLALADAERREREEVERRQQDARRKMEEVERQKQDPVWKRPL
jgi:hypothetical protein